MCDDRVAGGGLRVGVFSLRGNQTVAAPAAGRRPCDFFSVQSGLCMSAFREQRATMQRE